MKLSWNTIGLIAAAVIMFAVLLGAPHVLDLFVLLQVTVFVIMSILALSMAFIWGFGGILCFGQSAFFGLGAYAYAIAVINMGESTGPLLLAIALPALFAAMLGYFIFYGRLSDVYLAVITLAVTLILYSFINSTADKFYTIGKARLNGFNGISSIPPLNWPGDSSAALWPDDVFYVSMSFLILTYFGLRLLLRSRFGRVVVAIRENEERAELLGYDIRLYKLLTFVIGAAIAGMAGCLFTTWNNYVSPNVFSLAMAAQILMWVIIGGVGTLIGPIIGCLALQYLTTKLGMQQVFNTNLIFGFILMVFVLLVPQGMAPSAQNLVVKLLGRGRRAEREVARARAGEGAGADG